MIREEQLAQCYTYEEKQEFPEVDLGNSFDVDDWERYDFKKALINPKVGRIWHDYNMEMPWKNINHRCEEEPELGKLTHISYNNPVANLKWHWLFFNDSDVFRPAALAFEASQKEVARHGGSPTYTDLIPGTRKYKAFWKEEKRRCLYGYEPVVDKKKCGIKIPGEFYFYLNYFRIRKIVEKEDGTKREEEGFPDFLSMDYYWFKELDARENPHRYGLPEEYKRSLILAKSRRLGFSYKNAAGAVHIWSFYKNTDVAIVSQYGKKAAETYEKCLRAIDFLTQYTEFKGHSSSRTYNEKTGGQIIAGIRTKSGSSIGRKTKIYTITVNNKDDAAAGGGCSRVIFEEAGMIRNIKAVWKFTEPTLRAGSLYKGIGIIFGTGGEMEKASGGGGASLGFSEMFYDPHAHMLAGFTNIYDQKIPDNRPCGLFFNTTWSSFGDKYKDTSTDKMYKAIDKNGNILAWVGELALNKRRFSMRNDKDSFEQELTQMCKIPREAFLRTKGSVFNVAEIEARINDIITADEVALTVSNGDLVRGAENEIRFIPDIEGIKHPLDTFPLTKRRSNLDGCVQIAEQPILVKGEIPNNAYILSIDPIGIDSQGGKSMAAIYVVKTGLVPEVGNGDVVAWYVGRPNPNPLDKINGIMLYLARYYNAVVTHENDRMGSEVRTFFRENDEYGRMLRPPEDVVGQAIRNSNTNKRKTGHSMSSPKMKELGEIWLGRWLNETRPDGSTNLHHIKDIALLQELQSYNREANFDRVMAMMGIVLQRRQLQHIQKQSEGRGKSVYDDYRKNMQERFSKHQYSELKQKTQSTAFNSFGEYSDEREKYLNF